MNGSGRQVGPLAKFYSVAAADVLIIHDELDIDFGQIRLKIGGGEGGHNGLRSVAAALGTKDFQRVRIGIGRPPGRKDPAAFVLENFTAAERPEVPTLCEQAAEATELLIELGLAPARTGSAKVVGGAAPQTRRPRWVGPHAQSPRGPPASPGRGWPPAAACPTA